MKVEIDLPEIEGYEYTGEFRCANEQDAWLFGDNRLAFLKKGPTREPVHILRKKRWRADAGRKYWYVGVDCEPWPLDSNDAGFKDDWERWVIGNYFQTKEEAEAMAEKVRKLFKEGL